MPAKLNGHWMTVERWRALVELTDQPWVILTERIAHTSNGSELDALDVDLDERRWASSSFNVRINGGNRDRPSHATGLHVLFVEATVLIAAPNCQHRGTTAITDRRLNNLDLT